MIRTSPIAILILFFIFTSSGLTEEAPKSTVQNTPTNGAPSDVVPVPNADLTKTQNQQNAQFSKQAQPSSSKPSASSKAPSPSGPSSTPEQSIDEKINAAVGELTGPFVGAIFHSVPFAGTKLPLIVVWLVIAAFIFTLYFGLIQLRGVKHAIELVRGDYSNPNDIGEVSHFQALTTALSGTVGLGNIAGVAVAVGIGGPGATFWMILAGLLGMASKFCECTLGVKYRQNNSDGSVSGGPMYYLSRGFEENCSSELLKRFGRALAILFAIFCILGSLGGGNMFQANQAHQQLAGIGLASEGWLTGTIMAVVVFAVIVGGIKSIATVTEKVVPFMAVIYVTAALVIIVMNIEKLPFAVGEIFRGAFTDVGIAGGIIGALIQGFKRAAFSNEAGVGSAAIAHSAVKTNEPITEGLVSLLEPFIDTVVICTMTALVIIITGQLQLDSSGQYILAGDKIATVDNLSGVALTSRAFETAFSWFPYVLAIAVVLFAFSTMISWSYYGLKAWTYLFGESKAAELVFKVIFCSFVVIGAATNLGPVIDFSDAAIFAMALVNIGGLYVLMPRVKFELQHYLQRLANGEFKNYRAK